MHRLLRSSALRIALAFAAALTAITYLVFGLVYYQVYTGNVALVRQVLQDEIEKSRDAPVERLQRQLELRLTQDLRHLDYVGLYDKAGRRIFGNIASNIDVPADSMSHIERVAPSQPEAWQSENAVFVSTIRPDGGKLVLGRSLVYVDQLGETMLKAFVTAILPVVMLALLVGTMVSLRASRRLTAIQRAINRVIDGELDVRLPARGTPDDIDELVRAVNRMLDEIGRLLAQIKSVGDNIAHDLRAPLAVMRARLERGIVDDSADTLRTLAGEALADLDRAMTTVSALLRIAELENGRRRSAFAEVDLADVCRDAFSLYEAVGEAKGVRTRLAVEGPVVIRGDADLLREAIANLLDNAIKFSPTGGAVDLSCGASDAMVRVADTGPGVPIEERTRIFKRFYRIEATRDAPGVGLGLSMAATILELHGLAIRVEDNHPGAVFAIVPAPVQSPPRSSAELRH